MYPHQDVRKAKQFMPCLGNPVSGHCEAEEENTQKAMSWILVSS